MRVLFYKHSFAWPYSSGHDVHTSQMMRALASLGVDVSLATAEVVPDAALAGVELRQRVVLAESGEALVGLKRTEERFRRYWGVPLARIAALGGMARDIAADVVVVSGLDVLPMLGAVEGAIRVWYAGDEWVWHHLSQVRGISAADRVNLRDAMVKGLYERTYRRRVDRAWVVSERDRSALRWVSGVRTVDVLPNGVDADFFRPFEEPEQPQTAIFWGRLDFGPNIQALQWFVFRVWPSVRANWPAARFTIAGFRPGPEVAFLASQPGVELLSDVPDIRPVVAQRACVVLPFVSGGGIKNKLLEAAAMGKAIVASPRTVIDLRGVPPVTVARTPSEWVSALTSAWADPLARRTAGMEARRWVCTAHTWKKAATEAYAGLAAACRTGHS